MGMADDMKKITDDIIVSHNLRIKALGELFGDVHQMLKDFGNDRARMAEEQAKGLAGFTASLSSGVDSMIKGFEAKRKQMAEEQANVLAGFVADMEKNVSSLLKGFGSQRKQMSDEQSKALADFAADLAANVGNLIKGLQKEHQKMSDDLRKDLKQGKTELKQGDADRLNTFKGMMKDIQKCVEDIESYTADKLREFSDSRQDMSEELKKKLAMYVNGLVKATKGLLKGYAGERKRMASEWQRLTLAMTGKGRVQAKAGARVRTVGQVLKKETKRVKPEVETEGVKETGAIEEEDARSLEERILGFIQQHPEGIRVGEMESPLETPRMKLGVIAKKLLDEGRVRKEDNFYFPL